MFGYAEQERKPMTPERLFSQDTLVSFRSILG